MKKFLATILALALLVLAILPATAFATQYVTATGSVYVRAKANKTATDLGVVYKDAALVYAGETVKDSRGVKWYKVHYDNGYGWVSSVYATLSGGSKKAPASKWVKAVNGNTNVRTKANKDSASLGVLHEGETVAYAGEYKADSRGVMWFKVKWNGKTGWVSAKYSTIVTKSTSKVCATGTVYVRSWYDKEAIVLGTMHKGDTVTYDHASAKDDRGVTWYRVKWGKNGYGWISSVYSYIVG